MAQDRRYARIKHFHTADEITDLTDTGGILDTTYLRLDCDNDPLSGTLQSQHIEPRDDQTWDIGSESIRYMSLNASTGFFHNEPVTIDVDFDTTVADGIIDFNVLSESGDVYPTAVYDRTISVNNIRGIESPSFNLLGISGPTKRDSEIDIVLKSPGSLNVGSVFHSSNSEGSYSRIKNYLSASIMAVQVATSFNPSAFGAEVILGTENTNVGGNIVAGQVTSDHTGSASMLLSHGLSGQGGSIMFGTVNTSFNGTTRMETFNPGTFTGGYCTGGSTIETLRYGSLAFGKATSGGRITSGGTGAHTSFAAGQAQGAGCVIEALSSGACAMGTSRNGFRVHAGADGALARGHASTGVIDATATNSSQFGEGVNAEVVSLQVGEGIRIHGIKVAGGGGITGLHNGDIWPESTNGIVQVRSEGVTVDLSGETYGPFVITNAAGARYTMDTSTITAPAQLAEVLATLIVDLQTRHVIA